MNCWNCHRPVTEGRKFCGKCGASLTGPEQEEENRRAQALANLEPSEQNGPEEGPSEQTTREMASPRPDTSGEDTSIPETPREEDASDGVPEEAVSEADLSDHKVSGEDTSQQDTPEEDAPEPAKPAFELGPAFTPEEPVYIPMYPPPGADPAGVQDQAKSPSAPEDPLEEPSARPPLPGLFRSRKRLVILIAAVVVLIAAVVLLVVLLTGKTTVNLNKYLTVSEAGYNGYGYLDVTFDYDAFEEDYYGKIHFNKKSRAARAYLAADRAGDADYDENAAALTLFEDHCISYDPGDSLYLRNGDTATVHWGEPDGTYLSYLNCKVNCSDVDYTMSELESVKEADLFDDIHVIFSGKNCLGSAELEISQNSEYTDLLNALTFTLYASPNLQNGDTVTVTASIDGSSSLVEYCARYCGVTPISDTKTYTVSGLEKLPTVDLFTDVTVEVSGPDSGGIAKLVVNSEDEMIQALTFTMDVSSQLSNDDRITVTASIAGWDSLTEYLAQTYGVTPISDTKIYRVVGLK